MKKHGHYELLSVEEISCNIFAGSNEQFINTQIQRLKSKYRNNKRHKEKNKNRYVEFNKNRNK